MKEGDCFPLVGSYDEQFHPSINPKSENRNPKWPAARTPFGFRASGFGFESCSLETGEPSG